MVVAVVVVVCAGCNSQTSPTADRAASYRATTAYLRAREAFLRSSTAELAAGRAPMAALVAQVRTGCPGALRGTSENGAPGSARAGSVSAQRAQLAAAEFFLALEESLEAAQQEPLAAAAHQFFATVASIRWGDSRITNLVRTFAQIERERRPGPPPDVCRQINVWARSGYREVPAITRAEPRGAIGRRWMRDMAALGCGRFSGVNPREVLSALSLYHPTGRPTIREVAAREVSLETEQSHARAEATRALGQALGVDTSPRKRSSLAKRSRRSGSIRAPNGPNELSLCTGKPELLSEPVATP